MTWCLLYNTVKAHYSNVDESFLDVYENFCYLTETYKSRGDEFRLWFWLQVTFMYKCLWSTYSDEMDISCPLMGFGVILKLDNSISNFKCSDKASPGNYENIEQKILSSSGLRKQNGKRSRNWSEQQGLWKKERKCLNVKRKCKSMMYSRN